MINQIAGNMALRNFSDYYLGSCEEYLEKWHLLFKTLAFFVLMMTWSFKAEDLAFHFFKPASKNECDRLQKDKYILLAQVVYLNNKFDELFAALKKRTSFLASKWFKI